MSDRLIRARDKRQAVFDRVATKYQERRAAVVEEVIADLRAERDQFQRWSDDGGR